MLPALHKASVPRRGQRITPGPACYSVDLLLVDHLQWFRNWQRNLAGNQGSPRTLDDTATGCMALSLIFISTGRPAGLLHPLSAAPQGLAPPLAQMAAGAVAPRARAKARRLGDGHFRRGIAGSAPAGLRWLSGRPGHRPSWLPGFVIETAQLIQVTAPPSAEFMSAG